MDKIKCGTETCNNKVTHFNLLEGCYFCEVCALSLSDPNECEQLGNIETIKTLANLCQDLCNSFKRYVSEQKLEKRWQNEIETMLKFENNLSSIRREFEYSEKTETFSDFMNHQKLIFRLKTEIKNSKAFLKYLEHQEVTRLLNKGTDKDHSVFLSKAAQIISELNNEEELEMAKSKFQKFGYMLLYKPEFDKDVEEFVQNNCKELKELKEKHNQEISDLKKMHDQEMENLLSQRIEIEQHLDQIKNISSESEEDQKLISYEI